MSSSVSVLVPHKNIQPSIAPVQILEEQQELAFHLQQQRLIELIREGRVDDALEFAQENLAPLGEEHPALLEELGASGPQALPCANTRAFKPHAASARVPLISTRSALPEGEELLAALITDATFPRPATWHDASAQDTTVTAHVA